MSVEITYDADVNKAIGFFVTTVDECDNSYLGTEGPLWSKEKMEAYVQGESLVPGMGEIVVHCIMPRPVDKSWEAVAKKILDRESYADLAEGAEFSLQERLVIELHNAFVAGVEYAKSGGGNEQS
jgi:hypothetical protein